MSIPRTWGSNSVSYLCLSTILPTHPDTIWLGCSLCYCSRCIINLFLHQIHLILIFIYSCFHHLWFSCLQIYYRGGEIDNYPFLLKLEYQEEKDITIKIIRMKWIWCKNKFMIQREHEDRTRYHIYVCPLSYPLTFIRSDLGVVYVTVLFVP